MESQDQVPGERTAHVLLFSLIGVAALSNLAWAWWDRLPPGFDPGVHLRIAWGYWTVLASGSETMWVDLLNVEPFYPPLYHFTLVPFMALFGFNTDTAVLVNTIYLAVTILCVYGIGRRIYDEKTGLLAAFIVACYPYLAYISRRLVIESLLTALVALSYYLFLRSRNFENPRFSFLFGLAFAAGVLVKWTFLFYVLPAVVMGLAQDGESKVFARCGRKAGFYLGMIAATLLFPFFLYILGPWGWVVLALEVLLVAGLIRIWPSTGISFQKVFNLLLLVCLSVLLCFPWYAHNLVDIIAGVSKFGFSKGLDMRDFMIWDIPAWGYYIEALHTQVGLPFMILAAAAFVSFLFGKKSFNGLLFGWIVFSYIVFQFITSKDTRYTLPCVPALAIVSALFITRLTAQRAQRVALGLTLGVGAFTYFYTSFAPNNVNLALLGGPMFGHNRAPSADRWPIERILDDMLKESAPGPGETLTARTLTNHPHFQRGAFRDAAEIGGLSINVKNVKRNLGELTDYFISKDRGVHWDPKVMKPNRKTLRLMNDPVLQRTFRIFKKYPLPDGTKGIVFKREVMPANDIEGAGNLILVAKQFVKGMAKYPIYGIKEGVNLRAEIIPTEHPGDLYLGRYRKIILTADSVVTDRIPVHDFKLVLEGIQINLYELLFNGKVILFHLGKIHPEGTLYFSELEAMAKKAMKGKGAIQIKGAADRLQVFARYDSPAGSVHAEASARLGFEPGKKIWPIFESLKAGPFSIPEVLIRRFIDREVPLRPTPGWPMITDIQSIRIGPDKLRINPPPA